MYSARIFGVSSPPSAARFGALAKVVNKGEAPPSLVALLLQFLEAANSTRIVFL